MDLYKTIKDLHEQKKRLDVVIESLEEMQRTGKTAPAGEQKRRGRRFMDAEARKEVSERMKRYWAKRRKDAKAEAKLANAAPAAKKTGQAAPHAPETGRE
jgi:hypothetical protein